MSFEQDEKIMKDLAVKAINGESFSCKTHSKIIETKPGKPVSDDYIWDLFKA